MFAHIKMSGFIIPSHSHRSNICVKSCESYYWEEINTWLTARPPRNTELAMASNIVVNINGTVANATLDIWESDLGNASYIVTRTAGNQVFELSL